MKSIFFNKNIKVIGAVIAFVIFLLSLQHFINKSDYEMMDAYKPMVEASFKDGNFTQEKKVVDESLRYTITVEANMIVLKYSMMAEKGRQLTKVNMNVTKMGDSFVWSCQKDVLILPKYDC